LERILGSRSKAIKDVSDLLLKALNTEFGSSMMAWCYFTNLSLILVFQKVMHISVMAQRLVFFWELVVLDAAQSLVSGGGHLLGISWDYHQSFVLFHLE
jgi:hypothetical protein